LLRGGDSHSVQKKGGKIFLIKIFPPNKKTTSNFNQTPLLGFGGKKRCLKQKVPGEIFFFFFVFGIFNCLGWGFNSFFRGKTKKTFQILFTTKKTQFRLYKGAGGGLCVKECPSNKRENWEKISFIFPKSLGE